MSDYITKDEITGLDYERKHLNPASSTQLKILNTYRLTDEFRRTFGEYLFADNPTRESILNAEKAIATYAPNKHFDEKEYHDLVVDLLYSRYVLGYYHLEYFRYHFDKLSITERMEFFSSLQEKKYFDVLNSDKDARAILDNKYEAYTLLKPYYKRDIIRVTARDDFPLFSAFVKTHERFIAKPFSGYGGKGIHFVTCGSGDDVSAVFDSLIDEFQQFLCEEPIEAAAYMKEMYPHAINTVRIHTYYNGVDEPVPFMPFFRCGSGGAVVDNFSSGGYLAAVDGVTGTIIAPGVNNKENSIRVHPDTGVPFVGFQIRDWEQLLAIVKEAAKLIPGLRVIGWDMAASAEKGWQIVEGNKQPGFAVRQNSLKVGVRREFEKIVEWEKNLAAAERK